MTTSSPTSSAAMAMCWITRRQPPPVKRLPAAVPPMDCAARTPRAVPRQTPRRFRPLRRRRRTARLFLFRRPPSCLRLAIIAVTLGAVGPDKYGCAADSFRVSIKNRRHNRFGWQVKTATTNGVFHLKKPQFRIVEIGRFSYILHIRCRTKFDPEFHPDYVEYF
jgi:hypothetical protein